jgi:hypothetical protein
MNRLAAAFCSCFCAAAIARSALPPDTPTLDAGLRQAFERTIYSLKDSGHGSWTGRNQAQRLTLQFDSAAARLTHGNGSVGFNLTGYGYGDQLAKPAPATLAATGNRLEYRRGDLTEWYVNESKGLEQGFTFLHPPAPGNRNTPLVIALGVTGSFTLEEKDGAVLLSSGDQVVLRYAGLTARDARGRTLPSRLEVRPHEIRLVVEDRDARYPLVVDPTWSQQAELTASDGSLYSWFGYSVSVSGGTAVIGAYAGNGSTGSAYVFVLNGTTWSQQAELTASDAALGYNFGRSVAVNGGTALIGATGNRAVYVFVQSGTTWSQQAELTAGDGQSGDQFGGSVSLNGGTAVIGASNHTGGAGNGQGAAYVFVQSGTTWIEQAELTAGDAAANNQFGGSVSVSGGTVVIGAAGHTVGSNTSQGAAYVFVQSGTTWSQQQELTASDGKTSDAFGASVSVSGATAVVGASAHKVGTYLHQGAAYVFVQSGSAWSLQQELTASDGQRSDAFGTSVSVSGGNLVIGASGRNTGQGVAYAFLRSGSTWSQQSEFSASDGAEEDLFGSSVSLSGGVTVIGANRHATNGQTDQGVAYVFSPPASLSLSATHSGPIFRAGPGTISLTVDDTGGPTTTTATVGDTIDSGFAINSASSGCGISEQAVTCTLVSGSVAASTIFNVYVTASAAASSSISNSATLTDSGDNVTTATSSDTIAVIAQANQVDSSLNQMVLNGSTDNGACADGNLTLTATDQLQNTTGSTLTNPYAVISSLSGGNSLLSQSADSASVAPNAYVTFTFHIQLASCSPFQLYFDVRSN